MKTTFSLRVFASSNAINAKKMLTEDNSKKLFIHYLNKKSFILINQCKRVTRQSRKVPQMNLAF